ncbi:MAG: hypothetical protein JNL01_06615 [Bdellovibrionales bacterium]|nr:hypothetical protein [Bdellovibrionales bacterium]
MKRGSVFVNLLTAWAIFSVAVLSHAQFPWLPIGGGGAGGGLPGGGGTGGGGLDLGPGGFSSLDPQQIATLITELQNLSTAMADLVNASNNLSSTLSTTNGIVQGLIQSGTIERIADEMAGLRASIDATLPVLIQANIAINNAAAAGNRIADVAESYRPTIEKAVGLLDQGIQIAQQMSNQITEAKAMIQVMFQDAKTIANQYSQQIAEAIAMVDANTKAALQQWSDTVTVIQNQIAILTATAQNLVNQILNTLKEESSAWRKQVSEVMDTVKQGFSVKSLFRGATAAGLGLGLASKFLSLTSLGITTVISGVFKAMGDVISGKSKEIKYEKFKDALSAYSQFRERMTKTRDTLADASFSLMALDQFDSALDRIHDFDKSDLQTMAMSLALSEQDYGAILKEVMSFGENKDGKKDCVVDTVKAKKILRELWLKKSRKSMKEFCDPWKKEGVGSHIERVRTALNADQILRIEAALYSGYGPTMDVIDKKVDRAVREKTQAESKANRALNQFDKKERANAFYPATSNLDEYVSKVVGRCMQINGIRRIQENERQFFCGQILEHAAKSDAVVTLDQFKARFATRMDKYKLSMSKKDYESMVSHAYGFWQSCYTGRVTLKALEAAVAQSQEFKDVTGQETPDGIGRATHQSLLRLGSRYLNQAEGHMIKEQSKVTLTEMMRDMKKAKENGSSMTALQIQIGDLSKKLDEQCKVLESKLK